MSDFQPQQFGKLILITGIILSAVGGLMILLSKIGLFRLPGDIRIEGKHWKFYFPLASCLILSILLTLILWIVHYFKK